MNTTRVQVTIEGTTPLMMNKFTDKAAMAATSGNRTSSASGDKGTPNAQASERLYQNEKGMIFIPQPNIFRAVIDAGKFFKNGKSKITTQKSSLIPSCVEIEGIELPLTYSEPWTVDTRPVRIPATGGRILCHRPRFDVWSLSFDLVVDTSEISVKLVREIIDKAGKAIGLGDFRPDCKGPFGKFVVTRWATDNGNE